MQVRIRDLRRKEVINITDGGRLGFVSDVEFRAPEGQVLAIIVYGPARFFGLFGRGEEYYIPWDCIQRMGNDIILIEKPFPNHEALPERKHRRKL
ncbi:MAG: YlmC/YmxH family sporulation protein [Oscillibacter sp.]|nr:YlmC/YmxH family sporulation protein [Oscillibacter sp.]